MSPCRAAALVVAVLASACFDGGATIGAICSEASDCGPKQSCQHELCGRCGNGDHEEREVCYSERDAIDEAGAIASLHVADLDDNGLDDIVGVAPDGSTTVLLAAGGTFMPIAVSTTIAATITALGDVDGDADVDIVLTDGTTIAILLNDGAGSFLAGDTLVTGTPVRELGVAPGASSTPARLVVTRTDGGLAWAEAVGDGVFVELTDAGTDVHLGPAFYWNDDELADLAVVDHRSYRLTILGATADGFVVGAAVEVGRGPVAVVGVDRNGDGRLDFLTRDREGHSVTIVDGTKDLGLATFDTLAFDHEPAAVSAVDADIDGNLDILVGTAQGLELWRAIGGRFPEGVELSKGPVAELGVGRFSATPLFDVLVAEGDRLTRMVVTP